ncbi:MAG: DMT family transporter [candidate division Zixibacteria bacterium]|nr:DMT family transporter [candidate division Zixibacteria bacterium]
MKSNRGIIQLIFGAACISFSPILVKLIGVSLMTPIAIGFWRCFLGALILFSWASLAKKPLMIDMSIMRWTALAGFFFSFDLFFWHTSIIYAGAGLSTILGNTQVFASAILGYFIFKDRLTVNFFFAAIAAMVGVVLLAGIGSDIEFTNLYLRGIIYGLLTGLSYAAYLITVKYAGHKQKLPDFVTLMAWISLYTALFMGVMSAIEGEDILPPDLYSWAVLVVLALLVQSIGWRAISEGLSKIEAYRAGLILLLQPILATVWGIIIFSESFTFLQLTGAAITLGAIYIGGILGKTKATAESD